MATQRYISRFGPVELIFIIGFSFMVDAFNLMTLYLFAIIINPIFFIILRLIFSLMGVKSAASFIGFLSPTVYVVVTYMLERAKERLPLPTRVV